MRARTAFPGGDLALAALVSALVSLPVWFAATAPLLDFPFHVARMYVLRDISAGGPLARYYELGSFLIPNIGMDAVIRLLDQFLSVAASCRLFLVGVMALSIFGAAFLARTLRVKSGLAPLLAGLLVYNQTFASGFVNYLFAAALLPWAIGIFIRIADRSAALRLALGMVLCLVLYFAHMVGFAIFAAVAGALELHRTIPLMRKSPGAALARLGLSALPFALTLGLFVLASPTANEAGAAIHYGGVPTWLGYVKWKLALPIRQLSTDNTLLDAISGVGAAAIVAAIAVLARVRLPPETLVIVIGVTALALLMPAELFTARYVDSRVPVAGLLLLASGIDLHFRSERARLAVAGSLLILIAVRGAVVTRDWIGYDRLEQQFTNAYRALPSDSILFAATGGINAGRPWEESWRPPIYHFQALAVPVDRVFVPALWAHPAQQPIAIKPSYADIYALQTPNPLEMPDAEALRRFVAEIRALMAARRAAGEDHFGGRVYLLLLFPQVLGDAPLDSAAEIAHGERFAIYRVAPAGG